MNTRTWFMPVALAIACGCTRSTAGSSTVQATADSDATNEVAAAATTDASAIPDATTIPDSQGPADEPGDGAVLADAISDGPDVPADNGGAAAADASVTDAQAAPDSPEVADTGPGAWDVAMDMGTDMATDAGADTQPDAWFPVKGDVGTDSSLTTADTADSTGGPETTGPCKDIRKRGDVKILQDQCWDPPAHYCSGPEFQGYVFGCKADFSVCCAFPTSCWPCGWVLCPYVPPGGNLPDGAPSGCPTDWTGWMTLSMPGCAPHMPSKDQEFCWDGVPDEWKTPAFHMDGG
ncbi:MAG: hypothetical protein HY902_09910 [Deltaproteobacteria bacterium]|nr:hypothetical protein [Deltaproteobacteria bacterium]